MKMRACDIMTRQTVTGQGRLVGIISRRDIMRVLHCRSKVP